MRKWTKISLSVTLALYVIMATVGANMYTHICGMSGAETSVYTQNFGCCSESEPETTSEEPEFCQPKCCHLSQQYLAAEFQYFEHPQISKVPSPNILSPIAPLADHLPALGFHTKYITGFGGKSPPPPLYGRIALSRFCVLLI
ncbi:hypothetical protein [Fulvitalea axinellae]|uniref:hypothetical protein n=1 Tax=Fulvitalea axinellae TaxID=1182444 RepID=UPI0030CA181B